MQTNFNSNQSASISLRAVGLLIFYKSQGHYVPTDQVVLHFREGRDAIRSALGELVDHGFVAAEKYRVGKQWTTRYELIEKPIEEDLQVDFQAFL